MIKLTVTFALATVVLDAIIATVMKVYTTIQQLRGDNGWKRQQDACKQGGKFSIISKALKNGLELGNEDVIMKLMGGIIQPYISIES
jgi:hypothetical protein